MEDGEGQTASTEKSDTGPGADKSATAASDDNPSTKKSEADLTKRFETLVNTQTKILESSATATEQLRVTLEKLNTLLDSLKKLQESEGTAQTTVNELVKVLGDLKGKVGDVIETKFSDTDGLEEKQKKLEETQKDVEDKLAQLYSERASNLEPDQSTMGKGGSHSRKKRKTKRKNLKGGVCTKRKRKTMKGGYKNKNKSIYKNEIFPDMVK